MRENRPYGLEGGETGSTGLPYPYACGCARLACGCARFACGCPVRLWVPGSPVGCARLACGCGRSASSSQAVRFCPNFHSFLLTSEGFPARMQVLPPGCPWGGRVVPAWGQIP